MIKRAACAVVAAALATAPAVVGAQEKMEDPEAAAVDVDVKAPDAATPVIPDTEPAFAVEGGIGALGYLGGAAAIGPAWNLRITANLSSRFALEGNYVGSVNERPIVDTTLMMTALDGSVRYNILRGHEAVVQPFVTAGVGYAAFSGEGGDAATMTLPVGVGVERMMSTNIKIGGRFNYRPALFDDLGVDEDRGTTDAPGGDTWNVLAHIGGAF